MKITKVNYMDGEARFLIDGNTKQTFCIKLDDKHTKKDIKDLLKAMVPNKEKTPKEIYNELDIKSLEGEEL